MHLLVRKQDKKTYKNLFKTLKTVHFQKQTQLFNCLYIINYITNDTDFVQLIIWKKIKTCNHKKPSEHKI